MKRVKDGAWVMAIKKVPTDASIRIGSIWYPVRSLPAALARHTKLVFCPKSSKAGASQRSGLHTVQLTARDEFSACSPPC